MQSTGELSAQTAMVTGGGQGIGVASTRMAAVDQIVAYPGFDPFFLHGELFSHLPISEQFVQSGLAGASKPVTLKQDRKKVDKTIGRFHK
jgi:hypothetical protein